MKSSVPDSTSPATASQPLLRQCPTLRSAGNSLIAHRIDCGSCLQRQRDMYHKCYRCVYQGKPADFVAELPVELGRPEDKTPVDFIDIPQDV